MIRTVPIPKTVSRVGCAPGSGCCSDCGGGHLGDLATDPSQLMTGPNVNLNDPALQMDSSSNLTYTGSTGTIAQGLNTNTLLMIGGGLVLALLLTSKGR